MFGTVDLSAKPKHFVFFFLVLTLAFASCGDAPKATNSECYYETVDTKAEVINMKPHPDGNGRISVILDFKASVLALDDQEMGELKGVFIDHDFLERNHIEMGNQYEVTVSELIRGDCKTKLTVAFKHDLN